MKLLIKKQFIFALANTKPITFLEAKLSSLVSQDVSKQHVSEILNNGFSKRTYILEQHCDEVTNFKEILG